MRDGRALFHLFAGDIFGGTGRVAQLGSGRRQCTATDTAQYVTTARASIRHAPALVTSAPVSAHAAVRFDLKAGAT